MDNAGDDDTKQVKTDRMVSFQEIWQTLTDSGNGMTTDKPYEAVGLNCPGTWKQPPAPVKEPHETETFAFDYFDVMTSAEDTMSRPNLDNFRPQNSSASSERPNTDPRAAAASPTGRTVVIEKQAHCIGYTNFLGIQQGPNNDHTYGINPLYATTKDGNRPTIRPNKTFYRKRCRMLSKKVKRLRCKLDVLSAKHRKETAQASAQTEGITEHTSNKQLMSKYEQALKEAHKWESLCTTLQKLKSEPGTTPTEEKDVNGRSNVEVYLQLEACCTERDQYKSEVEQLKQHKFQMDCEMSQLRSEAEQLRKEMPNPTSAGTSRDEREFSLPKELEDNGILYESGKRSHKRRKCPRTPASFQKPCFTVSETDLLKQLLLLPFGTNSSFNMNIHEEDSTPKPNWDHSKPQQSCGPSSVTSGSISTMKAGSLDCVKFQASQQVPSTNDNGTTAETELLHQSSVLPVDLELLYQSVVPAVDLDRLHQSSVPGVGLKLLHQSSVPGVGLELLHQSSVHGADLELSHQSPVHGASLDKDYYHKHFIELSDKLKHLENQLAVTVQQMTKETSQVCVQTDGVPEAMQDNSEKQLVSQYEEAMKEVQHLTQVYNTLEEAESNEGSTTAKEAETQSTNEVDKMAIKVDQAFRQFDTCCNERALYKSEAEQLTQLISEVKIENGQLRTEIRKLRTGNRASSSTWGDKRAKLQKLRMNLARLLTVLMPDEKFEHSSKDGDTIDDILQQVLKEAKT